MGRIQSNLINEKISEMFCIFRPARPSSTLNNASSSYQKNVSYVLQ